MLRVLHLLPVDCDFQTARSVARLEAIPEIAAQVQRIGRGGVYPSLPAAILARSRMRDFDVIHAWGIQALMAAALSPAPRIIYSPIQPTASLRSIRLLRAIMEYRPVQVVVTTSTLQRRLVERGVPFDRTRLIRPGVDFSRVKSRRDRELRATLGFDDDDFVILAPGETTRAANHRRAIHAASILHVFNPKVKTLLWGRGADTPAVRRFADAFGQPGLVTFMEPKLARPVEFEQTLPVADAILVTADAPVPTLPIAICMAAGLPIVATVTPTVAELLEDRHTALMCRDHPRLIARRVLDLRDDPSLQWSISDRARAEAYDYFTASRFVKEWKDIYSAGG